MPIQYQFSVVVPSHNRPDQLKKCLLSLANQDFPNGNWNVIVVDDGSEPAVELEEEIIETGLKIRVLSQPSNGPSAARNAGVKISNARYVLFTDDDCQPHPNWAASLLNALEENPDQAVGGMTENGLDSNIYAEASQTLNSFVYDYYNKKGTQPRFFASNNLGVSKEAFKALGGFSTTFTTHYSEDRDFCDRWIGSGRKMHFVPHARVVHFHNLSFFSFLLQHFRYGTGARSFHLERELRRLSPPAIEPLSFYVDMLRFAVGSQVGIKGVTIFILVLFTQISHTFGYLWQRFITETFINY